ncbi:hypothetical protein OG819_36240 [Streptomyces sp. NBC_01549]|uniref:hypothetical protein n=1 Tax=Streptomyces sp. NBC_01549 TaxID=2975874 RepID=UPI00225015E7|nr:hypothetical protein [Streptomyces sp. NBC_01549]MCX4594945.1 hypothetical protein [Streptomyces sp. NBC_01549]
MAAGERHRRLTATASGVTVFKDGERRPAYVWICGGGFSGGTGSDPRFDGSVLAGKGVVMGGTSPSPAAIRATSPERPVRRRRLHGRRVTQGRYWRRASYPDRPGSPTVTEIGEHCGRLRVASSEKLHSWKRYFATQEAW